MKGKLLVIALLGACLLAPPNVFAYLSTNKVEIDHKNVTCTVEGTYDDTMLANTPILSISLILYDKDHRQIKAVSAQMDKTNHTFSVIGTAKKVKYYCLSYRFKILNQDGRREMSNMHSEMFTVDD